MWGCEAFCCPHHRSDIYIASWHLVVFCPYPKFSSDHFLLILVYPPTIFEVQLYILCLWGHFLSHHLRHLGLLMFRGDTKYIAFTLAPLTEESVHTGWGSLLRLKASEIFWHELYNTLNYFLIPDKRHHFKYSFLMYINLKLEDWNSTIFLFQMSLHQMKLILVHISPDITFKPSIFYVFSMVPRV